MRRSYGWLILLWLATLPTDGWAQLPPPVILDGQLTDSLLLTPHLVYWEAKAEDQPDWPIPMDQLQTIPDPSKPPRTGDHPVWCYFQLIHLDSLPQTYWLYAGHHLKSTLWYDGHKPLSNGRYVPWNDRTHHQRSVYIPIELAPWDTTTCFVLIQDFGHKQGKLQFELQSQSFVDAKLIQKGYGNRLELFSSAATTAIAFFLCLFTWFQYVNFRDRVYLFYSLYLLVMSLEFLKGMEYFGVFRLVFVHLGEWNLYAELIFDIIPLLFYAGFVQAFLDLPSHAPRTHHKINWFVGIVMGMLGLNLLWAGLGWYGFSKNWFLITWMLNTLGSCWL
ncbi:MAG: 7TM diverse intracellular signaling domain-containing protein, partial [Bacteroidota bacterium]